MADTAQASSSDTITARLARVGAAVRHCPLHELPHRVSIELARQQLAVTSLRAGITHPDGVRRPAAEVVLTVRDFEERFGPATFTAVSDLNPTDAPGHPLGSAILDATQLLWAVALGVDLANPLSDYTTDGNAWERHLAQARDRHHVRGSWRKHRESFRVAGAQSSRKGSAIDAVKRLDDATAVTSTLRGISDWLDAADAPKSEAPGDDGLSDDAQREAHTAPARASNRRPSPPRSAP